MSRTLTLALCLVAGASVAESPKEIVERADAIRNPSRAFHFRSTLTEYVSGKAQGQSALEIDSKPDPQSGQFRNLALYEAPPRDAGKAVLLDGRSLWFYDPAAKSSVRISPQQRLIGQASIGDVLTVTLSVDYTASLVGEETLPDAAKKPRECWHLDLKAASELSTYARVEYWVERGTYAPVKAKFYSDSGRPLKVLYFRAFEPFLDGMRPSEVVILDAVDSSRVTTVKSSGHRFVDIPESWYQREHLPRLGTD